MIRYASTDYHMAHRFSTARRWPLFKERTKAGHLLYVVKDKIG